MSQYSAAARAAILDGGLPGLLQLAGGALKVALFRNDVECSGNGYSRQTIDSAAAATNSGESSTADFEAVTFTPSGGSIVYDQVRVYNRTGATLLLTSARRPEFTISGEAHAVTVQAQIFERSPAATTAAELQAALDNQKNAGQPVVLAAVDAPTAATIRIDRGGDSDATGIGGDFGGMGFGEPYAAGHPNRVSQSNIVWTGATGGGTPVPIIKYTASYKSLHDFGIFGKYRSASDATAKADIGLDMRWVPGGVGKVDAQRLTAYWCDIAFRLSGESGELNCDESEWRFILVNSCNVGWQLNSVQTMGHALKGLQVVNVPTLFDVYGGGNIKVADVTIETGPTTLVRFNSDDHTQFGWNNSGWEFNNIKFDSQAVGSKLVVMDELAGGYLCEPVFSRVQFPVVQWTGEILNVSGRTKTTMSRCVCVPPGRTNWTSANSTDVPIIEYDRCTILPWTAGENGIVNGEDLFSANFATSKNDAYGIVRDCWFWRDIGGGSRVLTRIEDWEGILNGQL